MKVTNGINTVETTEFLKNIWIRDGYKVVEDCAKLEIASVKPEITPAKPEPDTQSDGPTYAELKSMAKAKGINSYGMKKEDIIEALGM